MENKRWNKLATIILISGLIMMLHLIGGFKMSSSISQDKLTSAVFAGGCFWCMEPPFEQLEGVKSVISGYAGGKEHQPKYKDVASGRTGHREAIQINYDANMVSYEKLLEVFWKSIDPTDGGGQFADRGHQYQSAIFYTNKEEKALAEQSLIELEKSGRFDKPVVTEILKATTFYPAEDYHQDYYKKNETHYKSYSFYSGRESFLKKMWSDSKKLKEKIKAGGNNLREKLTPLQYRITQEDGTEPAFNNEYWDNKKAGIYVDIVSGEPLFSSIEKYDSGTGWPSFYKPIEPNNILEKVDRKLFVKRTEVRSKEANSHLGHVFSDGPKPTGLRYCINSAALRFVPLDKLEQEGYGQYIKLFKIKEKK